MLIKLIKSASGIVTFTQRLQLTAIIRKSNKTHINITNERLI